jgi:N-acetylglutamate synthase-like GNAT family acetyltransferase
VTGYTLRRARGGDGAAIRDLVTAVYGLAYPRRELYRPEESAERYASGRWIGVVAETDGQIVGHMALEPSVVGRVAEMTMGMVMPEHRRHGVLERLRDRVVEEATRAGLAGQFVELDAGNVAAQALANRSPVRPCAITLELWPDFETGEGRLSFVRYFRYIEPPRAPRVCLPPRHAAIVRRIYAQFDLGLDESPAADGRHGMLVETHPDWGSVFFFVHEAGEDTGAELTAAHRAFAGDPGLACAYLELPLASPRAPAVCSHAEGLGFVFAGVTPGASKSGDALRLQCLKQPPTLERLAFTHPFALELCSHIASCSAR